MGRHFLTFALLLMIHGQRTASFNLDFGDIREMLVLGREIGISALESAEWIRKGSQNDSELNFPFIKKMERKLMEQIATVNRRLDNLEVTINQRAGEIIDVLLRELPRREQLDRNLYEMNRYLGRIDDFYRRFLDYALAPVKYEGYTMKDFAKSCVSNAYGDLPDLLESIHRLLVPLGQFDSGLLALLANNSQEAAAQICKEQQSPQQLLYNLYTTIALAEVKGYAMMQFSYSLLRLYNNGSFDEERSKIERDYLTRTSETLRAVRIAMAFAPRDLWKCDSNVHKEGTTYTELKQLFQGYIVNEVDLNPSSTCRENCAYYSYAKVHGCYDNLYCSQQRKCNGKVLNCQYFDSDMWICPSTKDSHRRYEYIEYENGNIFGNKGTCKRPTTKVDSWWRWLFWHCSYCMCYCDDHNSSSERYFNLREITSDVVNNKVITGLQLRKVNGIIHMQIQQGVLIRRGDIEEASVEWKPVDNYTILDRGVVNGRDFHTLSWEKRAIDLDDLSAPDDHVLTGVRWRMVGAHLNFEIRVTPFNFTSGQLINPLAKSTWISNDKTDNDHNSNERRTEFKLDKPDIPTRAKAPNFPDSKSNQFLNFGPTDLGKDAAQTTVPFIDIQPVVTNPPFPLSGAGIFHKGRDGYGGYIAVKLITYDFKDHLRADLPPRQPVVGLNDIPVV
ncbi:uncharacterized protein LOC107042423 isoform X1 [Diachasma alloeum]|uniref:uncharacterized protein LOC107042423 isoform X1 n=1 Tax=Diachasma alloeum TaxID=454923 RepID=UPI0007381282|nr:uncharacterized protein LOC107042423 isoform X1 [Diachasma alloeum]